MALTILIILAGGIGALGRHYLSIFMNANSFFDSVFLVNVLGCFILGLVSISEFIVSPNISAVIIATGFCGAFTTFSTLFLQASKMKFWKGLLLILHHTIFGIAFFMLGSWILLQI